MKPAILIPHFDGGGALLGMVQRFVSLGYPVIAVSQPEGAAAAAVALGCAVTDAGGGDGLRAGLQYYQENMDGLPGVVVFEPEDGFSPDDALRVAEAFEACPDKLVIASRRRNPRLGLFTNLVRGLAGLAFTLVHGRRVPDPWASLKALPSKHVPGFLNLKGDGCRLHMNMLLNLQHMAIKTAGVPVGALYDYEAGSRLADRAVDIFKILLLPLKFVSSSLLVLVSDYIIRFLAFGVFLPGNSAVSLAVGRFTGAAVGYLVNRNVVFKHQGEGWRREVLTVAKFALLATINYALSLLLVELFRKLPFINFYIASPIADGLLYVTNYLMQRDVVFRKKKS